MGGLIAVIFSDMEHPGGKTLRPCLAKVHRVVRYAGLIRKMSWGASAGRKKNDRWTISVGFGAI
jgi:hypothetical protein